MLRNKGIIGMILGIIVCGSISFAIATNNMIDSSLVSFIKEMLHSMERQKKMYKMQ